MTNLPSLSSLLRPLHLLLFSTLLGTSLYQSFIMTKICYRSLPRTAFISLQKRVFPLYFKLQTLLLLGTALTLPPYGPTSLVQSKMNWIPFAVAGLTAMLNLGVYEPRTRRGMVEREERRKVKLSDQRLNANKDESEEMMAKMHGLNRTFSKNHAMCIHLNLVSMGAIAVYGWRLAGKFQGA